jgi:molybdenum cofactor cytidylyltransferase
MGTSKLLLPWGDSTVIARLLRQLQGLVDSLWVLVRADDSPLQRELAPLQVHVVTAELEPTEMRDSVELLLRAIEARAAPVPEDGWLLIPADHPVVQRETLEQLLARRAMRPEAIQTPRYAGRRGHPTLFPWSAAAAVFALPRGQGVNALVRQPGAVVDEVELADEAVHWDLDTPEDYERLRPRD